MYEISHELKMMLLTNTIVIKHVEKMDFCFEGKMYKIPAMSWNEIKLDLKGQPRLFSECEEWHDNPLILNKINVGPFVGLWVSHCDQENMTVNFLADIISPRRKHWKDWFQKGVEHASE